MLWRYDLGCVCCAVLNERSGSSRRSQETIVETQVLVTTRTAQSELALQLPFCFEVRALSHRLVSSTLETPCDDVCGLNPLSSESDGDAADFLD
jgi:hypothetical protein